MDLRDFHRQFGGDVRQMSNGAEYFRRPQIDAVRDANGVYERPWETCPGRGCSGMRELTVRRNNKSALINFSVSIAHIGRGPLPT